MSCESCWVHFVVGALSQISQAATVCRILLTVECGAVNRVCSSAQLTAAKVTKVQAAASLTWDWRLCHTGVLCGNRHWQCQQWHTCDQDHLMSD